MDARFKQARKEGKFAFLLTITYLIGWIATAYFLGTSPGILGLPHWFEASCVFLPIAFIALCWLIVTRQFKDMSLTSSNPSS